MIALLWNEGCNDCNYTEISAFAPSLLTILNKEAKHGSLLNGINESAVPRVLTHHCCKNIVSVIMVLHWLTLLMKHFMWNTVSVYLSCTINKATNLKLVIEHRRQWNTYCVRALQRRKCNFVKTRHDLYISQLINDGNNLSHSSENHAEALAPRINLFTNAEHRAWQWWTSLVNFL